MTLYYPLVRRIPFFILLLGSSTAPAQHNVAKCKGPVDLEKAIAAKPTAALYDALGAYFGQGDNYACAISSFRKSLRLKPDSWQTRYYFALALLASGDPRSAVHELGNVLSSKPDLTKARMTLGVGLSQTGQTDAAIEEFTAVFRSDPQSVTALDWLAKLLISQSRYAAAIAVLKNGPVDDVLQMDMAIAYSKSGDDARAIQILSQMIKDRPTSAAAHSALATIYTQQRRNQEAANEFEEALRLKPDDDLTRASYIRVLILLSDLTAAEPIAESYLRRNPSQFDAFYLAGTLDRQLGKYREAMELLTQAAKMDPKHYDARYNLGLALAKSGKPAEARQELEKALELNPTSSEARFQLANVLRSLSLPDEAKKQLELYQQEIKTRAQKDEAAAKASQGKEALQNGDVQRALDLYHEATELDPTDSQMFYNLALALDRKADYSKERESLERAIELDPKFAAAYNQVGFLRMQASQFAEAEKYFKTAILIDPHYAEAQNNLGALYGQQGNDVEAERLFRMAIKSNPGYAEAFVNLGVTLASQSRFVEADSNLRSALQLDPNNQEAQEARVMIKSELSQRTTSK